MLFFLFSGCSFMFNPVDKCTSSSACKKAFGDDYTCNTHTGYCEQGDETGNGPIAHNRCQTFPENLVEDWTEYKDVPVIGAMMSTTAYRAEYKAIEMAIQNVKGHHANTVLCDNSQDEDGQFDGLSNFDATEDLVNYLWDNFETPIVVGPGSSTLAKAALPKLVEEQVVLISAMATGDGLVNFANGGGASGYTAFWRTSGPASSQARDLVTYFKQDQQYEDILILHEHEEDQVSSDTDRIYLADDLDEELEKEGYRVWVAMHDSFLPIKEQAWMEIATPSNDIDAIIFVSDNPQNHRQLIEAFQDEQPDFMERTIDVYLGQHALSPALLGVVQDSFIDNGSLYTFGPGLPSGPLSAENRYSEFHAQLISFASVDSSVNPFTAYAYDAMMLAYFASAWAQIMPDTDGSGTAEYQGLLHLSDENDDAISLDAEGLEGAQEVFSRQEGINVYGASGSLDFGDLQDFTGEGGEHELLSPTDISQISPNNARLVAQCFNAYCIIEDRR